MNRRLIILLLFTILTVSGSWVQAQINEGKQNLRIGLNYQSPPFCFVTEKGDTVGVDLSIANELAKKISEAHPDEFYPKPEFVDVEGAQYREGLLMDQTLDFIVAIYSITPEREDSIKFSDPYIYIRKGVMVLSHKESEIKNVFDLESSSFGFVMGSTSETFSKRVLFPTIREQTQKVVGKPYGVVDQRVLLSDFFSHKLDAIIDDTHLLQFWYDHYKEDTKLMPLKDAPADKYGIGISPKHHRDTLLINALIDSITVTNGLTEKSVLRKWLDEYSVEKPQLIGELTSRPKYGIIITCFIIIPLLISVSLIVLPKFKTVEEEPKPRKPPAPEEGPVNYAWIIANSSYEYRNSLSEHPYKDAKAIKNCLAKYNYEEDNVIIQKDATRKGILNGFLDISCRNENTDLLFSHILRPIDNLLIYFSGHGDKTKVGDTQMGFWIPVDTSEYWNYIPDYEIKSLLSMINLNQVLLISDSCFSGMLINSQRNVSNSTKNIEPPNSCVEVITSGNSRVPTRSDFLTSMTEVFDNHSDEILSSQDLYSHIRNKLGNNRHYQPQFGSLGSTSIIGQFRFTKPNSNSSSIPKEELNKKIILVLSQFSTIKREYSAIELKQITQLRSEEFNEVIKKLREQNLIFQRSDKSIFVKKGGLSYVK